MDSTLKHGEPRLPQWCVNAVVLWLLLMAVTTLGYALNYRSSLQAQQQQARTSQHLALEQARTIINVRLGRVDSDLRFLADNPVMLRYLDDGRAEPRALLSGLMQTLMATRTHLYDQLRYLDADGMEQVRINKTESGPQPVADDALQGKSGRYYFTRSLPLQPGELYLSPLDLNVEHGQVERPFKPTLRLSTRTFDARGQAHGIVVLNYLAEGLLERLRNFNRAVAMQFWLVNQNGYWLIGPTPDEEWGFMLPERRALRFGARYPEVWQRIQTLDAAQNAEFSVGDEMLMVSSFLPDRDLRLPDGRMYTEPNMRWYLISRLPAEVRAAYRHELIENALASYIPLALVFALLCGWVAWLVQRRRLALEALQLRERQVFGLLNAAPDGIVVCDGEGRIRMVNTQTQRMFGFSSEALIGQPVEMLMPERFRAHHARYRMHYMQQPVARAMGEARELFACTANGREFPISVSLNALETEDGYLVISAIRDISARIEADRERNKLLQIIEHAPDYVGTADMDGRLLYHNAAARRLIGLSEDADLSGMHIRDMHPPWAAEKVLKEGIPCVEAGNVWCAENALLHRDGHEVPVSQVLILHRDEQGRPQFLSTIMRDISDLKATMASLDHAKTVAESRAQALRKARHDAEMLAETKSAFLANMSHEIRTPMNAVLGLAYVLEKVEMNKEAVDLAHKIRVSGESLLGILNDILDFSKIEAGKLNIESEPFYLNEVLDNLATIMAASAEGKGLELVIVPPPQEVSRLEGDALRIGQVLINLTSNAIKFTPSGVVEVKIELLDEHSRCAHLRFSVRDSGIGMDTDTIARLFVPFAQADVSTTRRFGGTGLGLAISRRLVELMGGSIQVASSPGAGSVFSFTLALKVLEAPAQEPQELQGLNVLVADDTPIALEGLGATIASIGWQPELFASGDALLRRVLDAPELQSAATVLLLDWKMPAPDGLAVAEALATELPEERRPIMLLISARSARELQDEPQFRYIDEVLSKPLGPSMLYNVILRIRRKRLGLGCEVEPGALPSQRLLGLHILVVDDSEINCEVAERIFGLEGARISLAHNGREALDWLQSHAETVDIILMDVHMPVMDGLEATRRIRALPALASLPVVALTAGALQAQREKALAAGMSGFIPKPFVADHAIRLILSLTGRPSAALPLEAREALAPAPVAQLINRTFGLSISRSEATYRRYLRLFVQEYGPLLTRLEPAMMEDRALQGLAHKMRGAAANLGLELLAQAAGRVEEALLEDGPLAAALTELQQVLARTLEVLEAELDTAGAETDAPVPVDTVDLEVVRPLIERALAGLSRCNPDAVEPALRELEHALGRARVLPIDEALDAFEFAETAARLRALADALEIPVEVRDES